MAPYPGHRFLKERSHGRQRGSHVLVEPPHRHMLLDGLTVVCALRKVVREQILPDLFLDRCQHLHLVSIVGANAIGNERSEEHTSELQSLMRISYAVFCLNKKKQNRQIRTSHLFSSENQENRVRHILH